MTRVWRKPTQVGWAGRCVRGGGRGGLPSRAKPHSGTRPSNGKTLLAPALIAHPGAALAC